MTLKPAAPSQLKASLGQAVALLPGKSEGSLMLRFAGGCRMWFAGEQDGPIVMVDAAIYGSAPPQRLWQPRRGAVQRNPGGRNGLL